MARSPVSATISTWPTSSGRAASSCRAMRGRIGRADASGRGLRRWRPVTPRRSGADRRTARSRFSNRPFALFIERGFHSVKLEDIAEAAGVTARALYRHYENKQASARRGHPNRPGRVPERPWPPAASGADAAVRPLRVELPDLIAAAVVIAGTDRAVAAGGPLPQRRSTARRCGAGSMRSSQACASRAARGTRPCAPQHSELRAWAVSSTLTSLGRHNMTLAGRRDRQSCLYQACMAAARTPAAQFPGSR